MFAAGKATKGLYRASGGARPCAACSSKESPVRLLSKPPGRSGVLLETWHLMPRHLRVNPFGRLERGENRLRDLVDRTHPIDLHELAALPVVGRNHGGVAVVGG